MKKLFEVLRYILKTYTDKSGFSQTRLVKMIFLADWFSAVKYGKPITEIEWRAKYDSPMFHEFANIIKNSPDFKIELIESKYHKSIEKYSLSKETDSKIIDLTKNEIECLEEAMNESLKSDWFRFSRIISSTYPILETDTFEVMNLEELAKKMKLEKSKYEIGENLNQQKKTNSHHIYH